MKLTFITPSDCLTSSTILIHNFIKTGKTKKAEVYIFGTEICILYFAGINFLLVADKIVPKQNFNKKVFF